MNQIAQTLDIRISHASTKHAETKGILERTHASSKTSLKISTGERRSMWHKYVQNAFMNYNTSYHESLGCEPTLVFHGRHTVPHTGHQTGAQAKMEKRRRRRSNGRTTEADNGNSPSSQRQPYAIIFKVQAIL